MRHDLWLAFELRNEKGEADLLEFPPEDSSVALDRLERRTADGWRVTAIRLGLGSETFDLDLLDPEAAVDLLERADELDDYELKAVLAVIEGDGMDPVEVIDLVRNGQVMFYEGMDPVEVAQELVLEGALGSIDSTLLPYIDYEAVARDLEADGYYVRTSLGTYYIAW